jgi:hypothetical protein
MSEDLEARLADMEERLDAALGEAMAAGAALEYLMARLRDAGIIQPAQLAFDLDRISLEMERNLGHRPTMRAALQLAEKRLNLYRGKD